jgi:hypothetical protein
MGLSKREKQALVRLGLGQFAWLTAVFMMLSGFAVWSVFAATFNTYFNNVEQGNNGTSNNTIHIDGAGKASDAQSATTAATTPAVTPSAVPVSTDALAPAPVAPVATSVATRADLPETPREGYRHFMVGASGLLFNDRRDNFAPNINHDTGGGSLSLGYGITRDIGVRLTGGAYAFSNNNQDAKGFAALDAEVMPIHVGLFRAENALELGVLGGANIVNGQLGGHGGLRANVNFSETFSLTAAVRVGREFNTEEAGIAIRM